MTEVITPFLVSLMLYCVMMMIVLIMKPNFLYTKNGNLKKFGLGNHSQKTIFPLWLFALLSGMIIYFGVQLFIFGTAHTTASAEVNVSDVEISVEEAVPDAPITPLTTIGATNTDTGDYMSQTVYMN